ncbi:hypothetical protein EDB86DRAFT_3070685 [Lactarius hatsudake]|nr:hypothetical protein EDB86DRAFT_3070685 [Lactarius hatsudake]
MEQNANLLPTVERVSLVDNPQQYPSLPTPSYSGTYNATAYGPIITSGSGQFRIRDDGNAHWDYNQPQSIEAFPSNHAAGISPQDSAMNLPESEEPIVPAIDTTQVNRSLMQALDAALGHEACMKPRLGQRALPTLRLAPATGRGPTVTWGTQTGLFPDLYDPNALKDNALIPRGPLEEELDEEEYAIYLLVQDERALKDELARAITDVVMGKGGYYLTSKLPFRREHDFPFGAEAMYSCSVATLTALDAGTALHDGELVIRDLTP